MSIVRRPRPTILGIETSCDETAAAVVNAQKRILSNVVVSQWNEHRAYGGVVPEIAARAHIRHLPPIIEKALQDAAVTLADIDAVAVTAGPGLIGGVIVGVMMAKGIASAAGKPLVAVNHLEGHALTARLTGEVEFPYLLLLVSGGHCQFLVVEGVGRYRKLGGTMDDALGEAFDKTAKLLGLGQPGGPAVERLAAGGDAYAYDFSVPLKGRAGCDFSFSGIKTAVRQQAEAMDAPSDREKANLCASFQRVVTDSVIDRLQHAAAMFREMCPQGDTLVVAGGVAANRYIGGKLKNAAETLGLKLAVPPPALCTDNAAMIAWAGLERFRLGISDGLDIEPKARWPL